MRIFWTVPDGDALVWLPPMLDALTEVNRRWLRAHPAAPSILAPASGVVYCREPIGREEWRAYPGILEAGCGDCEDLACAHAAYLLEQGQPARAVPIRVPSRIAGTELWHVVVETAGRRVDPSAMLGMNRP